jgi:FkbM family methyltransferase
MHSKSDFMFSSLRKSWSIAFVLKHMEHMSIGSTIRYWNWTRRRSRTKDCSGDGLMRLRLKKPFAGDVWLRTAGSDGWTFQEILISQVYKRVVEKVASCRYLIDLGANIGLASRFFAYSYPECRIFAIEPLTENFCQMERNLRPLLRSGRCHAKRAAAWGSNSNLMLAPVPLGNAFDSVHVASPSLSERGESVDGYTMSALLEQSGFPHVDILKIDIEGAETELFKGNLQWLGRVKTIAIEFHQNSRMVSGFDEIMQRHGFSVDETDSHTVIASRS